jgi:hypothetical protein
MPENKELDNVPQVPIEENAVQFGKIDYSKVQGGGRFYANHVATGATLFDVRIVFSDVDADIPRGGVIANQMVTILMSPELASILELQLRSSLEGYIKSYGKTRLPEGAVRIRTKAPEAASESGEPAKE